MIIEFIQWWEFEMLVGVMCGIMDQFEKENFGIKVMFVSGFYVIIYDQIVVGVVLGMLSDVVGFDGVWVNGLIKQGVIMDMGVLMDKVKYDCSQFVDIVKVDGKSVMFLVVLFVYLVFVNFDLVKVVGVDKMLMNRLEFVVVVKKMIDVLKNVYGWVFLFLL